MIPEDRSPEGMEPQRSKTLECDGATHLRGCRRPGPKGRGAIVPMVPVVSITGRPAGAGQGGIMTPFSSTHGTADRDDAHAKLSERIRLGACGPRRYL
jgi:hypothetical protein